MILGTLLLLSSYVIGGFHSEIITKETYELLNRVYPAANASLHASGVDKRIDQPLEWSVKVVNGNFHALKTSLRETKDEFACFLLFEDYLKKNVEVLSAKLCHSIIDIIPS